MTTEHQTVLLEETVTAVIGALDGVYIDGTFGRGGHSRLLLSRLGPQARVIGVDKDPEAVAEGKRLAQQDVRFSMVQGSFADLPNLLRTHGISDTLAGVLLDLGVSSPQLDVAERGFSFLKDGALDMRMNPAAGQSAAEWLALAEEDEIVRVLREYGEERFARRIARAIVSARQEQPLVGTLQFARIVAEANPAWEKGKHPATRTFQAIRIHINDELTDLERFLAQVLDLLSVGGRLAVISFHSLEDRLVKRFIRTQVRGDELPAYIPVTADQMHVRMRSLGKAIQPSEQEVAVNPRARSAVLRIAEKVA
ncbi:MAG: rRNA ((1402)-N(4))-methyltransferase [Verrucomicrobiaceae bacterium]|nr:rRNA ((1402)-N(4))-methyltransferase [Verrucomicrobiaceae bacterium]